MGPLRLTFNTAGTCNLRELLQITHSRPGIIYLTLFRYGYAYTLEHAHLTAVCVCVFQIVDANLVFLRVCVFVYVCNYVRLQSF